MDTIERKKKIEELVGGVLSHARADILHAESNLRLLRRQSSDANVDWFLGNIIKQAIVGAASLQLMCRELDEQGLTTAELAAAVEDKESFQDALLSSPDATPEMIEDWAGDTSEALGDPSDPGEVR